MIIYGEICGVLGWAINLVSYHRNNLNKLLFMQILASIFFCLGYFLLGAYSGLFICFLEMVKMYAHYKSDKDDLIFLISLPFYALIAILTCHEPLDYVPVIASLIDAYTISKTLKTAVFGGFLSYSLWFVYDMFVLAYASALTDAFIVLSNVSLLVSFVIGYFKSKDVKISDDKTLLEKKCETSKTIELSKLKHRNVWPILYKRNRNTKIIGYVSYEVITEDRYNKIYESKKIEPEEEIKRIKKLSKSRKNFIQIDDIFVEKKFQNKIVKEKIKRKLKRTLNRTLKNGYEIDAVIAIVLSDFEKELLDELSFDKVIKYDSNTSLLSLNQNQINELIK